MNNNFPSDNLSPTKKALLALKQMQQKLAAVEKAHREPIAIIGMGCRFPGANNPDQFWQLLVSGQNAITQTPASHWDIERYCNEGVNTPGKICNAYGGYIPHLKEFDASFFRIAPREAISLDPQQRLLLEVSWEALENSAIPPESLQGSATGIYLGICGIDYWHQLLRRNPSEIDAYLTTGNTHSLASGRLAHFYGTTAPSISLDTACSGSLVALHLAIKSLRDRESNLALVGGVNRLIAPEVSINFSQAKMLSHDGLCKTFDDRADGFVRSEGCGIVIVKRLSDAIADGDHIRAVLLGSAVNQDGRTSSITTPNSLSQQAVIQQALANSQVEPTQVSYLESHGTGTALGDLIELEALSEVFSDNQELILGAVKTNIGHLEAASGIASLIKAVLALERATIPANLHLQRPNQHLEWQNTPFTLPQTNLPWQKTEIPRIAGVSTFGFSGTNAHVVIQEAPNVEATNNLPQSDRYLFTLSARNKPALEQLAETYVQYLQQNPQLNLADICLTVNTGRSHFNHRLAMVATSTQEIVTKLTQFLDRETSSEFWRGRVKANRGLQIAIASNLELDNPLRELAKSLLVNSQVVNPQSDLGSASLIWEMSSSQTIFTIDTQEVIFTEVARSEILRKGDRDQTNQELQDLELLLPGLAQLYILGIPLNWQTIAKHSGGRKIPLPTYAFQRQIYWFES